LGGGKKIIRGGFKNTHENAHGGRKKKEKKTKGVMVDGAHCMFTNKAGWKRKKHHDSDNRYYGKS